MLLKDASITILFDREGLKIELRDNLACTTFAKIELNAEQACQVLSRSSQTACKIEVKGLDHVGKNYLHKEISFQIPRTEWSKIEEVAIKESKKHCPEGWISSEYFGSQGSFFEKAGRQWAKTTIMKWEEMP